MRVILVLTLPRRRRITVSGDSSPAREMGPVRCSSESGDVVRGQVEVVH